MTRPDGTTYEVETNQSVIGHCVDSQGDYLGLIDPSTPGVATMVSTAPPGEGAWRMVGNQWQRRLTLAERKALKWQQMKEKRSSMEFGTFIWDGSEFDCDEIAQNRINGGVTLATLALANDQPFDQDWTLADNTVRNLSASQMIAVGIALAGHVNAVHTRGREVRQAIQAASSRAEVDAIVW